MTTSENREIGRGTFAGLMPGEVPCSFCDQPLRFDQEKGTFVHSSSGSLYVCKHGNDPRTCPHGCSSDDHCGRLVRS